MLGGLPASVAGGDELLRGTRYHRHGDAAGVDGKALERRISLALLVGSLLQAIAAVCAPQAMGPWDRQPVRSAGRLANYLDLHTWHFAALALEGVAPRNYRKNPKGFQRKDLRRRKAA